MRYFAKDKASSGVIGAVIAVLVTLAIGMVVINGVANSMPFVDIYNSTVNGTSYSTLTGLNATITAQGAAVGSVFAIANIYPIVIIAGAMLAVIAGAFVANQ